MNRYVFLLLLVVLYSGASTASDLGSQEGKNLLVGAEEKTNIFALAAFSMKASVRIDNNGKAVEGTYDLLWNGPDQWREAITFPGYTEIQVGGKGLVFLERSTEFLPLRIHQLHSTLGYGTGSAYGSFNHIAPGPKESVKKVRSRTIGGRKANCAEIANEQKHTREVCIDATTGLVLRQDPFTDSEIAPVGTKLFPRNLSYAESGKTLVEVQVTELKATEPLPSSIFDPPQGAIETPGCMNPNPPRLTHRIAPRFPEPERQARAEGTVRIYARIAKDGVPRELRVISGVTPGLNDASLDAVQRWRYEPATCSGTPVVVETVVTVNYSLR